MRNNFLLLIGIGFLVCGAIALPLIEEDTTESGNDQDDFPELFLKDLEEKEDDNDVFSNDDENEEDDVEEDVDMGDISPSLQALGINAPGDVTVVPIRSYGPNYQANKLKVVAALKAAAISDAVGKMLFAVGMLETNTYDPAQRDTAKTGDSTNYSAFNINRDMITRLGFQATPALNTWQGLGTVAQILKKAVATFGVNGFLNYHRGGYTGWKDGVSYGCAAYRNGIASMVRILDANPSLLTDDRRIDIVVAHV